MKKINIITHYIFLLNSNLLISFFIIYRDLQLFDSNFDILQRTPIELLLIFNLLNIIFYLVVDYIYNLSQNLYILG